MNDLPVIKIAVVIAGLMLVLSLLFAFLRMAKGPDLPNRILALDLISIISIGILVDYVFYVGETEFLAVGVVQSLVAFSGTIAVAKYLEKKKFL